MAKTCKNCKLKAICSILFASGDGDTMKVVELLTGKYHSSRQVQEILAENCEHYKGN